MVLEAGFVVCHVPGGHDDRHVPLHGALPHAHPQGTDDDAFHQTLLDSVTRLFSFLVLSLPKVAVSQDFWRFFHESNPPGPLLYRP